MKGLSNSADFDDLSSVKWDLIGPQTAVTSKAGYAFPLLVVIIKN